MHTFIIAEAGVNHNGSVETAKQLIDAAVNAGVDCVKFQTFKATKIVTRYAQKADYQRNDGDNALSQFEMLKKLELSESMHTELLNHCNTKGIIFLSTAFDDESIDLLKKLSVSIGKIPSGEITNLPYLRKMSKTFSKIILSTGMATMSEIEAAIQVLEQNGTKSSNITILHCNTEYPTKMQDVNLLAMLQIQKEFKVNIGYSDHTLGIEVPIAAVALGATVIEKHFTLSRTMQGPDHAASLEPKELSEMVKAIRNIELALGDGIKKPSLSEIKNKAAARKSIVAARKIEAGEILSESNLAIKRPGTGISPMMWDEITGTRATKDFEEDELIII